MKLIALCGAAGAGKDTAADMLPARKLAFADTLYAEVAAAWGVSVEWLKGRSRKDVPQLDLALRSCDEIEFIEFLCRQGVIKNALSYQLPRSPRQILQWWGDYRRAQDRKYFVDATTLAIVDCLDDVVITDVRFPNEAAMVRQLGGQIWQIKRPGYEAGGTGHASDTDGSEFAPDRVLLNSGSLDYLRDQVFEAWGGAYDSVSAQGPARCFPREAKCTIPNRSPGRP